MKKLFLFLILSTLWGATTTVQAAAFVPTAGVDYYLINRSCGRVFGGGTAAFPTLSYMAPDNTQYLHFIAATDSSYYIINGAGKYITRGPVSTNTWDIIYTDTAFRTNGFSKWYVYGSDSSMIRIRRYADAKFIGGNNGYLDLNAGFRLYSDKAVTNGNATYPNSTFQLYKVADKITGNLFDGAFEKVAANGGPWGTWIPKKVTTNVPPIGASPYSSTVSRVNNGNNYQSNGLQTFALRFLNDTVSYISISQKLFNLVPGATYQYSFNYKNVAASLLKVNIYAAATENVAKTSAIGNVFATDSTQSGTTAPLSGSVTFVAPNTSCFIVYKRANTQYNQLFIDDISLTKTAEAPAGVFVSTPFVSLDEKTSSALFSVTGTSLTDSIRLSAPAGITLSPKALAPTAFGTTNVTATFSGTTATNGYITITSGSASTRIRVIATKNSDCYTPLYSGLTNLIADPTVNDITKFGGWGATSITTDTTKVYCGSSCGLISGGSLDRVLTGLLKVNTKYRVKAMINASNVAVNLGVYGWSSGQADYVVHPTVTNTWTPIEMIFTTGAALGATHGLFYNNAPGSYIDNWEMYAVPKVYTSSTALTYLGVGTKKVSVRAESLTSNITITAPAGFSVTPSSMLSTVSGATTDSVAVTFNGGISASGYVYFTSGTSKDSIQVTGTVAPTLVTSVPYVSMDELNPSSSFTVTGGNLVAGVTMSAPAGITLTPSSLPSTASGSTVTVTYDGNANSTGYITLTSTTATTRVRVRATRNADTFTPLYSTATNLIGDTYLNDIANFGGWGNKIINADTAFVYSGARSGKVYGSAQCGGSLDKVLTGVMKVNTKYRTKAVIYATGGSFQLGIYGWSGSKADTTKVISTTDSWQTIDFDFTTGATLNAGGQGIFFNSCWIGGTTGYIDNWELYEVPSVPTSVNSTELQNQNVYVQNGKIVADFNLPQSSSVEFSVYNTQGMLISSQKGNFNSGANHTVINANLTSGVYIVKIAQDGKFFTRKVIK
jgi:hypothetical protein